MTYVERVHSEVYLVSGTGTRYAWPLRATASYIALVRDPELARELAKDTPSREIVTARGTALLKREDPADKCWWPGLVRVWEAVVITDARVNAARLDVR